MQPIVMIGKQARFKKNVLVRYLLDAGGIDMNQLASLPSIPQTDREQFAQLIGYSVDGFAELSYVSEKAIREADKEVVRLRKKRKRTRKK
jgi:hypothetical protein